MRQSCGADGVRRARAGVASDPGGQAPSRMPSTRLFALLRELVRNAKRVLRSPVGGLRQRLSSRRPKVGPGWLVRSTRPGTAAKRQAKHLRVGAGRCPSQLTGQNSCQLSLCSGPGYVPAISTIERCAIMIDVAGNEPGDDAERFARSPILAHNGMILLSIFANTGVARPTIGAISSVTFEQPNPHAGQVMMEAAMGVFSNHMRAEAAPHGSRKDFSFLDLPSGAYPRDVRWFLIPNH